MAGDSLEVYCQNKACGEPEVHTGITGHHETTKYRKMNYMGSREVKTAVAMVKRLMDKESLPSGVYYLYQCPVCGARRAYHESAGLIKEVDAGVIDLLTK